MSLSWAFRFKYFIASFPVLLFFLISCERPVESYDSSKNIVRKTLIVQPRPEYGFNWPYLLYIPKVRSDRTNNLRIIVYPNNSPISDDFVTHQEAAISRFKYFCENIDNRKLDTIALCPIFPRWKYENGGWRFYTHAFDRDTLLRGQGDLERLDLQLISMINDAKRKMENNYGFSIESKILMFGFSASAHFVDRFSFLHPEVIKAIAIGGFNGHIMIPEEEFDNKELVYPVGLYDYREITGREFSKSDYRNIEKLYFLGKNDTNNDVPFNDGYDELERSLIHHAFGKVPEGQPVSMRTQLIEEMLIQKMNLKTVSFGYITI